MRSPSLLLVLVACGTTNDPSPTIAFDLDGPLADATFWDLPFPSDLRLTDTGAPDMAGFPNPRKVPLLESLLSVIPERRGWPVMPAAYFRFTAPIADRAISDLIAPGPDAPALLIDIDATSTELGATYPIVAQTLAPD